MKYCITVAAMAVAVWASSSESPAAPGRPGAPTRMTMPGHGGMSQVAPGAGHSNGIGHGVQGRGPVSRGIGHGVHGPSQLPAHGGHPGWGHGGTRYHGHSRHGRFYGGYSYPYSYGYNIYAYPSPYDSYYGFSYSAPLYLPAETLYGPGSVQRFMGVDGGVYRRSPDVFRPPADPVVREFPRADPDAKAPVRRANQRAVDRAVKVMEIGDDHFSHQKYASANMRYREAARTAPDMAEAFFRQGFANLAQGMYESAARVFRRGLELDPDWPNAEFRVDDLYGDNRLAKAAHLDALAAAATERPDDAELMFLVGVFLHFDGQPKRAAAFFERAVKLAPDDIEHVKSFLKPGGGVRM